MRALALGCLLCGMIAEVAPAAAQLDDDALELDWTAPDECGDEDRLLARLSPRVGDRAVTRDEPLEVSAEIERVASGFVLSLRTPSGERRLEAASCDELIDSAAVILALLLDPRAPVPVPEPEPDPDPTPLSPIPISLHLRAELLTDLGLLPSLSAGPGIAIALSIDQTMFELSGAYLPTQDLERSDGTDDGDLRALLARFGVCQLFGTRPAFGPCLFVEHGRLFGRGSSTLGRTEDVDAPMWLFLAAARLSVPLGTAFGWNIELSAGLPTEQAAFKVRGRDDPVHETGDVVGRLRTGFELRL